jgi:multidrug efflux pump subunit AcrA (membrane-fusion protein)
MLFRRISLIVAVLILVGGFGLNKVLSAKKEPPRRNSLSKEASLVSVRTVQNGPVMAEIPVTGRLVARQRLDVFAEVNGRLLAGGKPFREGSAFAKGEILLRLDNRDQRLNLVSRRAEFQSQLLRLLPELRFDHPADVEAWSTYASSIDPEATLPALPEGSSEATTTYLRVQGVEATYYAIKSGEAQLAKYIVRAPFSGVVTNGDLDPGTLVRAGVPVGTFLNPRAFEWEASLSVDDLPYVRIGQEVQLSPAGGEGNGKRSMEPLTGRVQRISDAIDPATQSIKLYVSVDAPRSGIELFEGQYLSGTIVGEGIEDAVAIPQALLREDAQVWVVEDGKLALQPVEVVFRFAESVAVRGLSEGELMVDQRLGGAFVGMPVRTEATAEGGALLPDEAAKAAG